MGNRYVATVRFHTEGVEAELYDRLMKGKKEAGISVPDYIKQILKEYFENEDREDSRNVPHFIFRGMEIVVDAKPLLLNLKF